MTDRETRECFTPPGGFHRCQQSDDFEATARNLAALGRFANPRRLPPFPERRRIQLLTLWNRIPRVPAQRASRHPDLWPRPALSAGSVHDSSVPRTKDLR